MARQKTSLPMKNVAPGAPLPCAVPPHSPELMPGLPAVQRWQWQLGEAHQTAGQLSAGTYMLSPWPPARSEAQGATL